MSYTFNREFALAANEGSSQKAQNLYVIVHETANPTATGRNEATYMKRNWRNAYTQFIIGDGGIIYLIGEPGYVAYGALSANPYSPVQIELQHTKDKTMFQKNYAAYIWLIRWACDKYNIPKTLDAGKAGTKGVKSHKWVSDNIEGDHQDPYSYLASMGISRAQFKKDVEKGLGNSSGSSSTGNGLAKNPKPLNDGKVGDTVKVYDALYRDSTGAGRSTAKRGQQAKIKRIVSNGKKYLIENWGWAHPNDIQLIKRASSSSTSIKLPAGFTAEKATFINGDTSITTRTDKPSLKGKVGKQLKAKEKVSYLGWKVAEGYTWIYTTDKRYIPVRPVGKVAWGTFK